MNIIEMNLDDIESVFEIEKSIFSEIVGEQIEIR